LGEVKAFVAALCLWPSLAWAGPVVVLDPGHGGVQAGAKTKTGDEEKVVVLKIAKAVRAALKKNGVTVIMTRTDDRKIDLGTRATLANQAGAKAFISIHANYAPVSERRGAETYILSAEASDEVALAALHQEEAEEVEDETFGGGDLEFILEDLSRTKSHEDSAKLAKRIQDKLAFITGLRPSRGLRQAPFKVLRKAEMAAVLVEVGYLSNPEQGAFLASKQGQQQTGAAIARGILDYLRAIGAK
jgi:N-acetylmuramoyl-L-alanine amidase